MACSFIESYNIQGKIRKKLIFQINKCQYFGEEMDQAPTDIVNIIGSYLTPVNITAIATCSKYFANHFNRDKISKLIQPNLDTRHAAELFIHTRWHDYCAKYMKDICYPRLEQFVLDFYSIAYQNPDALDWFGDVVYSHISKTDYQQLCQMVSNNVDVALTFFEDEKFQDFIYSTLPDVFANHLLENYCNIFGPGNELEIVSNILGFAKRVLRGDIIIFPRDFQDDEDVDLYYSTFFYIIDMLREAREFELLSSVLNFPEIQNMVSNIVANNTYQNVFQDRLIESLQTFEELLLEENFSHIQTIGISLVSMISRQDAN